MGILLAVAFAGLAAASPASATTFDGSCALLADVTFDRPIPVVPDVRHEESDVTGSCFGRLNGRMLPAKGTPVQGHAAADQVVSCGLGGLPNEYTTTLTFQPSPGSPRSSLLSITVVEADPPLKGVLVIRGTRGGLAYGTATLQGGAPAFEQCLAGQLDRATVTFELTTVEPLDG